MNKMQNMLLDMLSWFHKFCIDNELRYYCVGGTALGAIRHGGFIPWDDDIDVGMPRKDYNKLISLLKDNEKFLPYKLEAPSEEKTFIYPYCKLYNTNTTLIEKNRYKTKRGVYIDVFPLDGAGNTKEEISYRYKKIDKKLNLISAKTCAISGHRKLIKNIAIVLARCIPGFIYNWKKLIYQINELGEKMPFDNCEYVSNFVGNYHAKEIMKREWLGNPTLKKFEGIEVYVPENYDAYLTHLYGNYMLLPPEEKRVTHHDYLYQNLNESYLK